MLHAVVSKGLFISTIPLVWVSVRRGCPGLILTYCPESRRHSDPGDDAAAITRNSSIISARRST
jgi:hypothetical protein